MSVEQASTGNERDSGQLALGLAAGRPSIPDGLRPMRARPAAGPFDSPLHLFEPVWSGRRVLAHIAIGADGGPMMRLMDARGRDLGPCLPELRPLPAAIEDAPLVLDGELVIADGAGKADPVALARRCRLPASTSGPPAVLLVFDVLFLAGRPLLAESLRRRLDRLDRLDRLSRLGDAGSGILRVPAVHAAGIELHEAARSQGLPAIRARRIDSPYLPGQRSSLWRTVRVTAAEPVEEAPSGATATPFAPDRPGSGAGPILAIFHRLPLHDAEPPAG